MRAKPQFLDDIEEDPMGTENEALGALIRRHREALGYTMEQLSEAADVGRTTLHRWEHGEPGRINPSKLGRVLTILHVGEDELEPVVSEGYREQLARWMNSGESVTQVREFLQSMTGSHQPDLMVFHPADGTVLYVQVKSQGENWEEARDKMVKALQQSGFLVGATS